MKRLLSIGLLLLCLLGCKEEDEVLPQDVDYLMFGEFYGFCPGAPCVNIYKLHGELLFEDTKDLYPSERKPYDGAFVARSDADYQLVKEMYARFPPKLLEERSPVIGSPDATDAGGIYLEVSVAGEKRFFLIDKLRPNVPEYLHAYLDYVEASIAALR